MEQHIYHLFEVVMEAGDMYKDRSRFESQFILRYHSQAVMGILRGWTDSDTEHLDEIVHLTYLLLKGEISPYPDTTGLRGVTRYMIEEPGGKKVYTLAFLSIQTAHIDY